MALSNREATYYSGMTFEELMAAQAISEENRALIIAGYHPDWFAQYLGTPQGATYVGGLPHYGGTLVEVGPNLYFDIETGTFVPPAEAENFIATITGDEGGQPPLPSDAIFMGLSSGGGQLFTNGSKYWIVDSGNGRYTEIAKTVYDAEYANYLTRIKPPAEALKTAAELGLTWDDALGLYTDAAGNYYKAENDGTFTPTKPPPSPTVIKTATELGLKYDPVSKLWYKIGADGVTKEWFVETQGGTFEPSAAPEEEILPVTLPKDAKQIVPGVYQTPDGTYYDAKGVPLDNAFALAEIGDYNNRNNPVVTPTTPYQEANLSLDKQRFAWEQQQAKDSAAAAEKARLAELAAKPINWLEYAAATGKPAVTQPWMMPLQPLDYAKNYGSNLQAGQPIPMTGQTQQQLWSGGTGGNTQPTGNAPPTNISGNTQPTGNAPPVNVTNPTEPKYNYTKAQPAEGTGNVLDQLSSAKDAALRTAIIANGGDPNYNGPYNTTQNVKGELNATDEEMVQSTAFSKAMSDPTYLAAKKAYDDAYTGYQSAMAAYSPTGDRTALDAWEAQYGSMQATGGVRWNKTPNPNYVAPTIPAGGHNTGQYHNTGGTTVPTGGGTQTGGGTSGGTNNTGVPDYTKLPDLLRPSAQYNARMGPTAQQEYWGYEQARTGAMPEETQFRLWSTAPPSGGRMNLGYRR
jgi:hypothetical protein